MTVPRRTFLGLVGAVAGMPAAQAISQKLAAHGLMRSALGGFGSGFGNNSETATEALELPAPVLFTSFADWWRQYGKEHATNDAREVTFLAADILDMKAPSLQAKVEMQRRRNLARIRKEKEKIFERAVSRNGVFKWRA